MEQLKQFELVGMEKIVGGTGGSPPNGNPPPPEQG